MLNRWLMSFGLGEKVTSYYYIIPPDCLRIRPLGKYAAFFCTSKRKFSQSNCDQNPKLLIIELVLALKKCLHEAYMTSGRKLQTPPSKSPGPLAKSPGFSFLLISSTASPSQSTHHITFLGTRKEGIINRNEEIAYTEHTWKRSKSQTERSWSKIKY